MLVLLRQDISKHQIKFLYSSSLAINFNIIVSIKLSHLDALYVL